MNPASGLLKYHLRCTISVVAVCLLWALTLPVHAASPKIESTRYQKSDSTVLVTGSGFGSKCRKCEVVADYGKFKYKLVTSDWSNKSISATVPDLGLRLKIKLVVISKSGKSNSVKLNLKPSIIPAKPIKKLVKAQSAGNLKMHEFKAKESLGDKGDTQYNVSEKPPQCGSGGFLFENANLVLGKRTRFGEAKIVKKPKKGCAKCPPLTVRYFYEPTGALHYQLHIYRRKIEGVCANQILK